jgi:hypothetical protein
MNGRTRGQRPETKMQSDESDGTELEALRREPEPVVPKGLEARIAQLVRNRPRAASRALPRLLLRFAAGVLIVAGFWLGTRLGDGICGGAAQQHEQMLAGEVL